MCGFLQNKKRTVAVGTIVKNNEFAMNGGSEIFGSFIVSIQHAMFEKLPLI